MWALRPEQRSAIWSVPNWHSLKGAEVPIGKLAAMGCGGHREGRADSSSSWGSLCIERIHPQTLVNRGTLTLESFGKIARRPHRFFIMAPSLTITEWSTLVCNGENQPGSSLCQARLILLCAGWGEGTPLLGQERTTSLRAL